MHRDDLFNVDPSDFLSLGGFAAFLEARGDPVDAEPAAGSALAEVEDHWGRILPKELSKLTTALEERGWPELYEWAPELRSMSSVAEGGGNLVEALIERDQRAHLGTNLAELFGGLLCLGDYGNSDSHQYGLYDSEFGVTDNGIYYFNHETADLERPFAKDLSSFVYLSCLCSAAEDGMISAEGAKQAFARLAPLTAPTWHYRDVLEGHELSLESFGYEPEQQPGRFLFYRAMWLTTLLRNDDVHGLSSLPERFIETFNPVVDDKAHEQRVAHVRQTVPTALYALFRAFFFDEEDHLVDYLRAAASSDSRFIRDAGLLVAELADGRKKLGTIDDVQALRRAFSELDLDPRRADARAVEDAEARRTREAAKKAFVVEVDTASDDALPDLLRDHLEDEDLHELVLARFRADPTMSTTLAIIDWIDARGYERDDLILAHELEEACRALAELGDARIAPVLVGRFLRGVDRSITARLLELLAPDEAAAPALAILGEDDKFQLARSTSLRLLTAAEEFSRLGDLAPILADHPLSGGLTNDVLHGDLYRASLEHAGRSGRAEGAALAMAVLTETDRAYDSVRGEAAEAVARLGHHDALPALATILNEASTNVCPAVPWALGVLAADAPSEQKDLALDALEACDFPSALTPWVSVQTALARLGRAPDDLRDTVEEALRRSPYGRDRTIERRTWALRGLAEAARAEAAPWAPELAAAHARSDIHPIRDAALEVFSAAGQTPPPLRAYYRFTLPDSLEELHAALHDEDGLYRYNVALELAERGDASSVPELVAALNDMLDGWVTVGPGQDTPYPLRWLVVALTSFGQTAAVEALARCLLHDDPKVQDPVLRAAPGHRALAAGMHHVVATRDGWMKRAAETWLEEHGTE